VWRDINLFSIDPFLKFLPILDRHDSGNDGYSDTGGSNPLDPIKEDIDVVEQLGEDELGTGIDFLL